MENKTKANASNGENRILITKTFSVPRDLVFAAFTEGEKMKQWWGPKDFTSPECKIDFRVGGKYLNCMKSPEGKEFWSTGTFSEIKKPERIVYTDSFADEKGNAVPASHYGMSEGWPMECIVKLNFAEEKGGTTLTLEHFGIPDDMVKECTAGWNESLDKLEDYLESAPDLKRSKTQGRSPSADSQASV